MDIKVYRKEDVLEPVDSTLQVVPNIIDFVVQEKDGVIENCELTLAQGEGTKQDEKQSILQECSLATIWQKGLDPLAKEDGILWSQAILGEITALQLIDGIQSAVSDVSTSVTVNFDTVQSKDGNSYLAYSLNITAQARGNYVITNI